MDSPKGQAGLDRLIKDEIEEGLTLDYKAAGALGKSEGKKIEISKDVSAMANSAGGLIIYGIREYSDPARKHKPEAIDPISRIDFPKEWLEHVINNVRPRLDVRIFPIPLDTGSDHVAYVVEIPQSDTARQASDFRYYKRFNFESVPMHDYEVRDVMGRVKTASFEIHAEITFTPAAPPEGSYRLGARLHNSGKITAYDVMVVIGKVPYSGNLQYEASLWDWKRETRDTTLLSKHPIHPGTDQALAKWSVGLGMLSVDDMLKTPRSLLGNLPAQYQGQPVQMSVQVSAKDQIQATSFIEYSKEEIEARVAKQFLCKGFPQDHGS